MKIKIKAALMALCFVLGTVLASILTIALVEDWFNIPAILLPIACVGSVLIYFGYIMYKVSIDELKNNLPKE